MTHRKKCSKKLASKALLGNRFKYIFKGYSCFAFHEQGEYFKLSEQHPRIKREKKTIDKMVHVYCKAKHHTKEKQLCDEYTEFLSYAFMRLDKCPFQEEKSTCGKCLVHCYQPEM